MLTRALSDRAFTISVVCSIVRALRPGSAPAVGRTVTSAQLTHRPYPFATRRPVPGQALEEAAGVVRHVGLAVVARPDPFSDVGDEGRVEVHHVGHGLDELLGHPAGEGGGAFPGLREPGSESPIEPGVGLEPPAARTALTCVARCTQVLHSGQTSVATVLSSVLVNPTILRALTWRRPPRPAPSGSRGRPGACCRCCDRGRSSSPPTSRRI